MSASFPLLYAACVTPLTGEALCRAFALVSPERREKTSRYRFEKDRRLSLGAELLLRHALRGVGFDRFPLEFSYNEQGRPFLRNSALSFSLSHSEDWVLCALSDRGVGCDIEKIRPIDLHLAERFFTKEESDRVASAPTPEARTELFFRYWTLKESFMKVTGLGMTLAPDEFELTLEDGVSVRQSVDSRDYFFREYAAVPGYRCALCSVGPVPDGGPVFVDLSLLLDEK